MFFTLYIYTIADIGRPDSVQSKTNKTYVAVGICGAFLVVVMCVIVVLVIVAIRKKQSQQFVAGMYIYRDIDCMYLSMTCLVKNIA